MRSLPIIALLLLLPLACSNTGAPMEAGRIAPDFRAQDLTGRTVYLNAELKRPVVLTFFATWCEPCRKEIPLLIDLHDGMQNRITILCLAVDPENLDKLKSMSAELHIPYAVLLDEQRKIMDAYGVSELPSTFLIGTDGRIVSRFRGFDDAAAQSIVDMVRRLEAAQ